MNSSELHPHLQGNVVGIEFEGIAFSIRIHDGVDRYISADIQRDGIWEPFETRVFKALCRPGDCVLDIGANIGWYSLVASACVAAQGRVIALEPEPRNFALLGDNLARNGASNVTALRVAAGARDEQRALYLSPENMGDHRLFEGDESRSAEVVEIRTLSSLLASSGMVPTLIKSDTQGSEWEVVQGLVENSFSAVGCCWLIEFWPLGLAGMKARPEQLLSWFSMRDYAFYELSEGNPRLVPTSRLALLERADTDLKADSGHFINLLVMHPDDARMPSLHPFLQ